MQRVIELTFADQDIRVVAVGDGQHAIDWIDADPPDIVLADVGMPTRDGYEVASFVKSSPRLAHIPVLLLTGAFEPVDEVRARAIGCDGLLVKPFEPQMVIARVKDLLAGRGRPADTSDGIRRTDSVTPSTQPGEPAAGDNDPLEQYFERLDKAFAQLGAAPSPSTAGREEFVARVADPTGDQPPATLAGPPPSALALNVADAFGVLLGAEQGEGPPLRPRSAGPGAWTPSDEFVEQLVTRVLQRLGDSVVRERVDEIVSAIAERLVHEEIDRIKASGTRRPPR